MLTVVDDPLVVQNKSKESKCFRCINLIIRPHPDWGNSYSCAKYWYGGCTYPSKYGSNLCADTKDFAPLLLTQSHPTQQPQQLTLF